MTSELEGLLKSARIRARCCAPVWAAITEHAGDVETRVAQSNRLCNGCLELLDECLRSVHAPIDAPALAPASTGSAW